MADGGEGTLDAFVACGWRRVERTVRGPLGAPVRAAFALDGRRAIVESASASGLALVAPLNDIRRASSYGTGELIRAALDEGARDIVVAVGGTATNDGAAGVLQALGARLLTASGDDVSPGGGGLARIASVTLEALDVRLRNVRITVANDVTNPLLGNTGASAVFAPQKGAGSDDIALLDAALARFADVTAKACGRDVRHEAGAGAGGGIGFGLRAYLGAAFRPGFDIVAEAVRLGEKLTGTAYCFSGEGSVDAQTLSGKTVDGVVRLARAAGVPAIAFAGRVDADAERSFAERGAVVVPLADGPLAIGESCERAAELLERAAARTMRLLALGRPPS